MRTNRQLDLKWVRVPERTGKPSEGLKMALKVSTGTNSKPITLMTSRLDENEYQYHVREWLYNQWVT